MIRKYPKTATGVDKSLALLSRSGYEFAGVFLMDALEITFLGTGTSVGIPVIGCDCAVCRSDDPRNTRGRSAIHVRSRDREWIVDAGPDIRSQLLREDIRNLDAALISHAHTDHIMGFDDLRRFTLGVDDRLPIYATAPTMAALKRAFAFAFDGENHYYSYFKPDPREITGSFRIGSTTVTPLPVSHGKVDTIGFLFETALVDRDPVRVAYISDCKVILPQAVELMHNLDVLIIDALRFSSHPTHMNFDEALEFRERVQPAKVWFTHLSCEVDHASGEDSLPADVRIAYDGLRLQV